MAKNISVEKEVIIWKDRKRILGLPLSFTRYALSEERLIAKIGFLNTITDEILLYRIMDVRLMRKLGQKIFGVGTVVLMSADRSHPSMELKNIRQSDKVRQLLSQQIDRQRVKRGMTSREFIGGLDNGHDHDFEGVL